MSQSYIPGGIQDLFLGEMDCLQSLIDLTNTWTDYQKLGKYAFIQNARPASWANPSNYPPGGYAYWNPINHHTSGELMPAWMLQNVSETTYSTKPIQEQHIIPWIIDTEDYVSDPIE